MTLNKLNNELMKRNWNSNPEATQNKARTIEKEREGGVCNACMACLCGGVLASPT